MCAGLVTAACGRDEPPAIQRGSLAEAYCHATISGYGPVDVEADYLPRVVQCENGNAGFEALKAQAVAARSYLYYKLDREGEIADSPGDQVYGCGRRPSPRVHAAVRATSGEVLAYRGSQVAGFYVAGAKQRPPACMSGELPPRSLAAQDPFGTEHYVTYNAGRRGGDIQQTTLGLIDPENRSNRGCKSQNGAACLAAQGWSYEEILRFYYGEDIELVQAEGACVVPVAERNVRPGSRLGAWIGLAAMLMALALGWLLVSGIRTRRRQSRGHLRVLAARGRGARARVPPRSSRT